MTDDSRLPPPVLESLAHLSGAVVDRQKEWMATIIEWLREVKAPQPYDFNCLYGVAATFDHWHMRLRPSRKLSRVEENQEAVRLRLARVSKAVAKLRNALTAFLEADDFKENLAFWNADETAAGADFRRRTAEARKMLSSLVDIDGSPPQQAPWVEVARDAYQAFQTLCPNRKNKVNHHPDNPARLFVARALQAIASLSVGERRLVTVLKPGTTAADNKAGWVTREVPKVSKKGRAPKLRGERA